MADQLLEVDGRRIKVSHPDKTLFPRSGISKGELVRYYLAVGPVMLAHVAGRPMSMERFPNGIEAGGFFHKDAPGHFPAWIRRAELAKRGGAVRYVVVDSTATLVYCAQQNMITPHVGLARAAQPLEPDRFVVDLDPSTDDFAAVREAALLVRDVFEQVGLTPFVQTTGSKGLHVVAPIVPGGDGFAASEAFGAGLAALLLGAHPDRFTQEFRKADRAGRIYLDLGRNGYGATMVAPYGVRAREHAPVATPIGWDEVADPSLGPQRYTIANVLERVAAQGDPWAGIDAAAADLRGAGAELARLLGRAG